MDLFILALLAGGAAYILKTKDDRRRIALLASHLGNYQIEKLMETLTQGYLRALGEEDANRREQIWQLLASSETRLCEQFSSFVAELAALDALDVQISKLPLAIPYGDRLFPSLTFDLRQALAIHAKGIRRVVDNADNRPPKAKAFTLSAELFLMQHTCHWFCKSKTIASARIMLRHQTTYEQALAAVSPETRRAYETLVSD
jgi:hypothetical protein